MEDAKSILIPVLKIILLIINHLKVIFLRNILRQSLNQFFIQCKTKTRIVIYDNSAMVSGARAWWMLREIYGAPSVHLLDGGMKAWAAEGRATESGAGTPAPARFVARVDRSKVRSKALLRAWPDL